MSTIITQQIIDDFWSLRHNRVHKWIRFGQLKNRFGQLSERLNGKSPQEYCVLSCANCSKVLHVGDVCPIRKCGQSVLYFCQTKCRDEWESKRLRNADGRMKLNAKLRIERLGILKH